MHLESSGHTSRRQICQHLRRSNALRIKSNNLQILPDWLQKSLLAIQQRRRQATTSNGEPSEQLSGQQSGQSAPSLLEQIRRGVRLRPIRGCPCGLDNEMEADCLASKRLKRAPAMARHEADGDSLGSVLIQVLSARYAAVQQSDDEDTEAYETDEHEGQSGGKLAPTEAGYGYSKLAATCASYAPSPPISGVRL